MIAAIAALTGALAVFVAIGALTGQFAFTQRKFAARAVALGRQDVGARDTNAASPILKDDGIASRSGFAFLRRYEWAARRADLLERANISLKVSEYIAIAVVLFLGVTVAAALASGLPLIAPLFGIGAVIFLETWVKRRARSRLNKFNSQLPTALQIMATSLKSGFGIMEAVATVARELDEPLAEEFERIVDDARVGGSFEQSMRELVRRMDSSDVRIVARALEIHRKAGGDLASILEQVAETMRERDELRGHIAALTAQQRLGGMIVGLLPLWVVAFFSLTDPDFISPLWTDPIGRVLLGVGAGLEVVAFFAMRKIMSIDV